MTFKVGDLAVYPGYGVGRVVSIESQDIMGASCEFYSIGQPRVHLRTSCRLTSASPRKASGCPMDALGLSPEHLQDRPVCRH